MKTTNRLPCLLLTVIACLYAGLELDTPAATLQEFGYDNPQLRVNGNPWRGSPVGQSKYQPLLVVLIHVQGGANFDSGHTLSYYHTNTFDLFAPQSQAGFFLENSKGRFTWSPAGEGTIGPLNLPASDGFDATYARALTAGTPWLTDTLYHSNLVARTMTSGLVDLQQFDDNANGVVTRDELCILFIANEGGPGAAGVRFPGPVRPPGFLYTVDIGANAGVQWQSGFSITAHELGHLLGGHTGPLPWDLYGASISESGGLTIMSGSDGTPDSRETFHLDPWHKMQLGWCEPRIHSLRAGGTVTLQAANGSNADAAVILYDPLRGTDEFFIMEYRTGSVPGGGPYERNLAGEGLVIWHVMQHPDHSPRIVPRFDAGLLPAQDLWRFCGRCKGLHHISNAGNPTLGPCPEPPAGGLHSVTGSSPYLVVQNNPSAPGQHGWRWCRKCRGLSFGPGEAASRCPAGGTHDGSQSGDYSLVQNDPAAPGQMGWRWCRKCQGISYGPNEAESDCPAGGQHDGSQSGNYSMLMEGVDNGVRALSAPYLRPGGSIVWRGGNTTPYLRWGDGTETRTRLHVRPFSPTDRSIVVEWWSEEWSEEETWVDFSFVGSEFGTFANPFNTLSEGVSASPLGGFVKLKPGSTTETLSINKRVILDAIGGPVVIGRQPPSFTIPKNYEAD